MSAFIAQLPNSLRELLASDLASVALFFVFMLEGAMFLYVAPSELLVPDALALVGERLLLPILAVAVLGVTVGQVGLFLVAKRGGREYLLSWPWFRASEDSLDRSDGQSDRWGSVVIPLGNAMLSTRGMFTVPAGLSRMSVKRLLTFPTLGTVVFESALVALHVFGGQMLT